MGTGREDVTRLYLAIGDEDLVGEISGAEGIRSIGLLEHLLTIKDIKCMTSFPSNAL